jgi:hypothetical protein
MSMTGARVVLIAFLVSLCGNAWGADEPAIPAGARVGIIDIVTNDVTHYHVGSSELNNFLRTYRPDWGPAGVIDHPLTESLSGAGFQPVMVEASDALLEQRESWLINKPRAKKLARRCLNELGRIMVEANLAAIIVAAPGANTAPEFDPRNRLGRLPRTTQGFGFSTSDEPDGITNPGVFDFTQLILVAQTADGPQLVVRDWGGTRLHDWPDFDPGANLKALSDTQLAPLRTVIAEAMNERIATRLMPALKP